MKREALKISPDAATDENAVLDTRLLEIWLDFERGVLASLKYGRDAARCGDVDAIAANLHKIVTDGCTVAKNIKLELER